jgi:hypothetical protein
MNNFKFSVPPPRTALLLTCAFLFTLNLIMSCRRDAPELREPQTPGDAAATFRAPCGEPGYCNVSVTAYSDAVLTVCGDMPYGPNLCSVGCDPGNDLGATGQFLELEQREFCVEISGRICVYNPSTTDTVDVRVYFGTTGTPSQFVSIPPGQRQCFHTNVDCDETNLDCN